jgi:hypothetical protein
MVVDDTMLKLPEDATTTRRQWLRSVGCPPAAGSLILPRWLDEAEAREGALDGKFGGRNGKRHHGRHHRRTHGDKDKDKARGRDILFRGIRFTVNYGRSAESMNVAFREQYDHGDFRFVPPTPDVSLAHAATFETESIRGYLWIDNRYYIGAVNPTT